MNKALIYTVLLILSFALVSADFDVRIHTNEFSLTSNNEPGFMCSCSENTEYYDITNVGNIGSLFRVKLETNTPDLFKLSDKQFFLNPGENKRVYATISIPCNYQGNFEYTLVANTNRGREKQLTKYVNTEKCQNINYQIKQLNRNPHQCQDTHFQVDLKNTATFTETYEISTKEYEEFTSFSEKQITIAPGQVKSIYTTIRLPCNVHDLQEIPFEVKALRNKLKSTEKVEYYIHGVYDYDLNLQDEIICSQVVTKLPVTVTNNAPVAEKYTITSETPDFVTFENKKITVEPGSTHTEFIYFNPSLEDESTHNLEITSTSKYGSITEQISREFDVEHCFENNIYVQNSNEDIRYKEYLLQDGTITDEEINFCCGVNSVFFVIENAGLFQETYFLSLLTPLDSELSSEIITLAPSEQKVVKLNINIPCSDETYHIQLLSEAASTGLTTRKAIVINGFNQNSCYDVDVSDSVNVKYKTEEAESDITSKGAYAGEYLLDLNSEILELQSSLINLDVKESSKVVFDIKEVQHLQPGSYPSSLEITHVDSNSRYFKEIEVNLIAPSAFEVFFSVLAKDVVCLLFFILLLIGLIVCLIIIFWDNIKENWHADEAIVIQKKRYSGAEKLQALLILIVVFAVLVFVAVSFTHKDNLVSEPPLYYEMYDNGEIEMDLDELFIDPDNDELSYSASTSSNLFAKIKDNIAKITASKGSSGLETVKFHARDPEGLTAESPEISVNVKLNPKSNLFTNYCALFFLIPLIVISFFTYFYVIDRGRVIIKTKKQKN